MLKPILDTYFQEGALLLVGPNGQSQLVGSGAPQVVVRLHDRLAGWQLLLNPDLKLGELYMDGRLTLEQGDLGDLLGLIIRNVAKAGAGAWRGLIGAFRQAKRSLDQLNSQSLAKARVAHHYDLPPALYEQFLDLDRQYSCAYFVSGTESIEQAQRQKKWHIMSKLCLTRPGLRILDIGCGWGGLALDLAGENHQVLGVTLSHEQITVAQRRAILRGLAARCRFSMADYRDLSGCYDRIVSVGMFEHVGLPQYRTYFSQCRKLMADDGVMLLHTIGRSDGPGVTNQWIQKYIFPGGYVPALSEILAQVERSGLVVTDIEVLRLHYAETLKRWRARFISNRERVVELFNERFYRMWEFYLAASEMAFRYEGFVVFQLQLARRQDSVPLTRDYLLATERKLSAHQEICIAAQ